MTKADDSARAPFELTELQDVPLTPEDEALIADLAAQVCAEAGNPSRWIDERHEKVERAVDKALAGKLPPNLRAACLRFKDAAELRRKARPLNPSYDAASLANLEGAYQVLVAEVRRVDSSQKGNRASIAKRGAGAVAKDAEVMRLVEALPDEARKNAPAALAALKALEADGRVTLPEMAEGELTKSIRKALAALKRRRGPKPPLSLAALPWRR